MIVHALPQKILGLVFDIDLTLYDSRSYYDNQKTVQIERLAARTGKTSKAATMEVDEYQENFASSNAGRKPSLGNTFAALGISIQQSITWREELLTPEAFLSSDADLATALQKLRDHFRLIAVTNNPASIGRKTLACLGVSPFFDQVIGLDTSGVSKPHEKPFQLAGRELSLPLKNLVSIGDRFAVDLEIPLKLGMGAILVESVEDVYTLPNTLLSG